MNPKPSLLLPTKRPRCVFSKTRPNIVVKITGNNFVKKLSQEEAEKLISYTEAHPGEYYKTEYWTQALNNGLKFDSTPDGLRLIWLSMQTSSKIGTNFSLSVSKPGTFQAQVIEEPLLIKRNIIVSTNKSERKFYDVGILEEKALKNGILEKFKRVVEKCRKIVKKEISEKEILDLLVLHKGNSKELIAFLINNNSQNQLQIIFEDCCSLSRRKLSYNTFLSTYIKFNGSVTEVFNYFSKQPKD